MGARSLVGAGLLLSLAGLWAVPQLRAEESAKSGKASCVDVHGDATFISVGYDHIVTLTSSCKVAMSCSVKTDVNPDATTVEIAPGEEKSVVTWRGSPARVFTPDVTCKETKAAAHGG
jgi:ABC-type Fe3+-hydroxamate transport system substrate-binding protein